MSFVLFKNFQIYFLLFAINSSNDSTTMHADTRLGHHGTGSLFRFYINFDVDRYILGSHNDRIEAETWLKKKKQNIQIYH